MKYHGMYYLNSQIWLKDIISSDINTDCVKVAKALTQYVKQRAETLAKDYPNMYNRMGGRVPKNLNYEALRLTRNELSEVYWQSTIEGYKDNPAIKAVKWLLSNNRIPGFHDVCDELAYADDFGLGAGIYPLDDVPEKPHICCLCNLTPIIADDIKKGDAVNKPPENWEEIKERLRHKNSFINIDELTEEQKETLREQRREAYRRQKEKKEAEKKAFEQKLDTLYSNPIEYGKTYRDHYGTKINDQKQNRHIYGHKTAKDNSSYFKNDLRTLQQIVNEKAGTRDISLIKKQLTEIIKDDRLKGFSKSTIDDFFYETNKAKIHYSNTGIHIVPTLKEIKND